MLTIELILDNLAVLHDFIEFLTHMESLLYIQAWNVQLRVGTITRWWRSTKLWHVCCLKVPVCTLESLPYSQPTIFTPAHRFLIFSVHSIQMVGFFEYRRERFFGPQSTESITTFCQKDFFWSRCWNTHLGTHSVTSLGKTESRFIIR